MSGKQAKRLRSLAIMLAGMKHQDKTTEAYKFLKANHVKVTTNGIKIR
jgi:hypothetical protein